MSSTGVMHGDGRRRGEEMVKHEVKGKNIAAVHVWYRNRMGGDTGTSSQVPTVQDASGCDAVAVDFTWNLSGGNIGAISTADLSEWRVRNFKAGKFFFMLSSDAGASTECAASTPTMTSFMPCHCDQTWFIIGSTW